jgi:hypothetical protein
MGKMAQMSEDLVKVMKELATEATYASVAHLEDKSKTVDESIMGIKQRIF